MVNDLALVTCLGVEELQIPGDAESGDDAAETAAVATSHFPRYPTNDFHPASKEICVLYTSEQLAASEYKEIACSFYLEDVGDETLNNALIGTRKKTLNLDSLEKRPEWCSGSFSVFRKEDELWPLGTYRADFCLDGEKLESVSWTVSNNGLGGCDITDLDLTPCLGIEHVEVEADASEGTRASVAYLPRQPTNDFHPFSEKHCVAFVSSQIAQSNYKEITCKFYYEGTAEVEEETEIGTMSKPLLLDQLETRPDAYSGSFTSLRKPGVPWPLGNYRADFFFDGAKADSVSWTVSEQGSGGKRINDMQAVASMGVDRDTDVEKPLEPTEEFSSDCEVIYVVWCSQELAASHARGDATQLLCQWVAAEVGLVAPPNTVIATVGKELSELVGAKGAANEGDSVWISGNFTLSRPNKGWPLGFYRCDIYVDFADDEQEKVASVGFSIQ